MNGMMSQSIEGQWSIINGFSSHNRWFLGTQSRELKRIDILLNKTREDYAKRDDVTVAINRLEEKIDRILERIK